MLESIVTVNNFLPFIFAFIFVTSLWYFKTFSSLMISASFFTLLEFSEHIMGPILWDFVSSGVLVSGIDVKQEVWAGTWITLNSLVILLINMSHIKLNIAKSFDTHVVCSLLLLTSVVILLRYVSGITLNSDWYSGFYTYALPILNLSGGLFLFYALLWNIFDVDIKFSLRKLPRG